MARRELADKLAILADAAKYDASCASSGANRKNSAGGLGSAEGMGICHSYTPDGRCVSLLKLLLTNHCIFDCRYCVNRASSDTERARFTVDEVVGLTMDFYRRNYIEGLFLSSGIIRSSDYTMEQLTLVAKTLRQRENFYGYIHLKTIPGASDALIDDAGLWADRLSVNVELTTDEEPNLDLEIDPKLAWALRHRGLFPVDINTAPQEMLLRVPGLGERTAKRVISTRRHHAIRDEDLARIGMVVKRARPFIVTADRHPGPLQLDRLNLRNQVKPQNRQLMLFEAVAGSTSGEL